ncbi:MAG: RlmE family RNA methyltransferase [Proteobacteria bacterium]|nr:RlmE family RNA methyltransferase [Pseudomonadota bacterium]
MKKVKDHYFHQARQKGYVARSAFKLEEINKKYNIIKKNNRVIDLGCYPGSWMQYISNYVGSEGLIVGVDRTELQIPLQNNMRFIHSDINELDLNMLSGYARKYDLICSDMAPNSTGIKDVDSARSFHLCQLALTVAQQWLLPKGCTLIKSFQGVTFDRLLKQMRQEYRSVKIIKPKSSRSESKEIFLLGQTLQSSKVNE